MQPGKSASATITELALALIIITVLLLALWYLLLRDRASELPNQTLQDSVGMVNAEQDTAQNALRQLNLTGTPTAVPTPSPLPTVEPTATPPRFHSVIAGETLSAIADIYGLPWEELAAFNGITDPRSLQIGQELKIPS